LVQLLVEEEDAAAPVGVREREEVEEVRDELVGIRHRHGGDGRERAD
jgi:hypothetical protein